MTLLINQFRLPFPIIPPSLAATIEIATPVALKFVGNTSVMRQSRAALAQDITALNVALTMRFSILFDTKYMTAEQIPAETVPTTKKNFRPNRSIPRTYFVKEKSINIYIFFRFSSRGYSPRGHSLNIKSEKFE